MTMTECRRTSSAVDDQLDRTINAPSIESCVAKCVVKYQMSSGQIRKLIHKVVILGSDIALQAGFLSRVSDSNLTHHLYRALGVSIGAVRVKHRDLDIALQLWSLPLVERCEGLTESFLRGHSGGVIILRPGETSSLQELVDMVLPGAREAIIVILVGSVLDSEGVLSRIEDVLDRRVELQAIDGAADALRIIAERLVEHDEKRKPIPVLCISEDNCPPFDGRVGTAALPLNSEEEINFIRRLADSLSVLVRDETAVIPLPEGTAIVDLVTGSVTFLPASCEYCQHSCKRKASLCIVGLDSGWSSDDLGRRALLTCAKIYAFATNSIPDHVRRQIVQVSRCSRFTFSPSANIPEPARQELLRLAHRRSWTLLDAARSRVRDGRLSVTVYDLIRRRLRNAQQASGKKP